MIKRFVIASCSTLSGIVACSCIMLASGSCVGQAPLRMELLRDRMIQQTIIQQGVTDKRVIQSIRDTPRHEFIPTANRKLAYYDMSVPIGFRQTISSPFIVAFMTETLEPEPTDKVLEIGTGSGYQAAVLSPLVKEVYSIEIVPQLGERARRTLKRLRYKNVFVKIGDGFQGWKEHAPFDKIIVTCSPEEVPRPLIEQLRDGGRLVIPVGRRYQQTLYLFRKKNGELISEALRPTLFVPMTGAAERKREQFPDPLRPSIVNGSFEGELLENGHFPGWYYQRQMSRETNDAPHGESCAVFRNDIPGRSAYALQGFAVDGRRVREIFVAAMIRMENVQQGTDNQMVPVIAITFYDHDRREVGRSWLGPWTGSRPWGRVSEGIKVPAMAREAIIRIGLFGATGEFAIDGIQLRFSNQAPGGKY